MNTAVLFTFIYLSIIGAADSLRQPLEFDTLEPAYKVFYENGFYDEAIELLRSKIKTPLSPADSELIKYKAYCFIGSGKNDSAIAAFFTLLNIDSSFYLDPVLTSPKIIAVYNEAIAKWKKNKDIAEAKLTQFPEKQSGVTGNQNIEKNVSELLIVGSDVLMPHFNSTWYQYPLCVLPGGVNQFYKKRAVYGAVTLALQTAGVLVAYGCYKKRDSHYDEKYGWYDGNRGDYIRYGVISKIGLGTFAITYTLSVIDNFLHMKKKVHQK